MSTSTVHPLRKIYLREIEEAFEVLINLKKDDFYNVPKINWWILSYMELYKYSYDHRHVGSCFEGMGCCCTDKNPENKFSSLYSSLREVIDLHQYEPYFREELALFENVKEDHPALMQWLKKNEKLGTEDFILFWIEWLEEDHSYVKPFIPELEKHDIRFKAEEWKNTIRFCEVFNDLYYEKFHN